MSVERGRGWVAARDEHRKAACVAHPLTPSRSPAHLLARSESVTDPRGPLRNAPRAQFPWRNGWFYAISEAKMGAGAADPMPRHTALLKEVGAI
jgi:hypothetical protein